MKGLLRSYVAREACIVADYKTQNHYIFELMEDNEVDIWPLLTVDIEAASGGESGSRAMLEDYRVCTP